MNNLRKTHPMVLVAAVALTMFSLLGSAAITGLLPSAAQQTAQARDNTAVGNTAINDLATKSSQPSRIPDRSAQPVNRIACMNCGTVVAILTLEGHISNASGNKEFRMAPAYQIKLRMHNGTYQTLTQHTRPQYLIGDVVRLQGSQATV